MNQGENAPPLHARCRCTIVAYLDGGGKGTRATRDSDGKYQRIPADMSYRDWKAVYVDKTKTLETWRAESKLAAGQLPKPASKTVPDESLQRRTNNQGVFAHLEVPMQKRAVEQICRRYGVDITGLRIKIQRGEDLLRADFAGMTAYENIGRIDLTPHAFVNEEQLLRTIIHEGCHVRQLIKYGLEYTQANVLEMERVAKRYEEFYWHIVKRRSRNG